MSKQLILVVHGVGVREAGVATGQLSAALSAQSNPGQADVPWKPHSTDEFMIHESKTYAEAGLLKVFPAHLRRFKREKDGAAQERIVADYYWGDIAGTASGGLAVLVGVVKIVLGLSHAVRENAYDVFPGDSGWNPFLRRAARCAALVIHGPIMALNLVLMAGVMLTLGWHGFNGLAFPDRAPGEIAAAALPEVGAFWTEMALGLGTIGFGFLILYNARVFLLRHLATWLVYSGLLVLGTDLVQSYAPKVTQAVIQSIGNHLFNAGPSIVFAPGFSVLAVVLMAANLLAWVFAFGLILLVAVAAWAGRARARAAIIVPHVLACMSFLWMLLMLALWASLLGAFAWFKAETGFELPAGLRTDMVQVGLRQATPAGFGLVALACVGLGLHLWKRRVFDPERYKDPAAYLPERRRLAETHRLIVGKLLLWALLVFVGVMTVIFVLSLWPDCGMLWTSCKGFVETNGTVVVEVISSALVLTLAIIITFGRRGLAAGVAIFTDVLIYLNDHSWISRETSGNRKQVATTLLERRLGFRARAKGGYWLRGRIYARLYVLLNRLVQDEKPDEIVIVSHSQGTVIALDAIAAMGNSWVRQKDRTARLKLVTMGSPYTHLYAHYFPSDFTPVAERAEVQPVAKGGLLTAWINIFRLDDFVGTHVDATTVMVPRQVEQGWPVEHPVPRGGHTNYWVDEKVIAVLAEFLAYRPSDGKTGPAAAGG